MDFGAVVKVLEFFHQSIITVNKLVFAPKDNYWFSFRIQVYFLIFFQINFSMVQLFKMAFFKCDINQVKIVLQLIDWDYWKFLVISY